MRKPLIIGKKLFDTKKEALLFYKIVLNKYNFDEFLNPFDKKNIIDLIDYDDSFSDNKPLNESDFKEGNFYIEKVKIGKAQFNTKCFEIIWNDGLEEFISYIQIINRHQTNNNSYFVKACRNVIQDDLRNVKQKYFDINSKNGKVKCQESGELLLWEDLVIDHRQPNTFSVIVERFLEVRNVNIDEVEYKNINNILYFEDDELNQDFKNYHKEKAILRIVKRELNSSRTQFAKLKIFKKDLKIE